MGTSPGAAVWLRLQLSRAERFPPPDASTLPSTICQHQRALLNLIPIKIPFIIFIFFLINLLEILRPSPSSGSSHSLGFAGGWRCPSTSEVALVALGAAGRE